MKPDVVHIPPAAPTEHIAYVQQKTTVCSTTLFTYNLHILSCYVNDLGQVAQNKLNLAINEASINFKTHTHTHTEPFYSSVEFVRDNPGWICMEYIA